MAMRLPPNPLWYGTGGGASWQTKGWEDEMEDVEGVLRPRLRYLSAKGEGDAAVTPGTMFLVKFYRGGESFRVMLAAMEQEYSGRKFQFRAKAVGGPIPDGAVVEALGYASVDDRPYRLGVDSPPVDTPTVIEG